MTKYLSAQPFTVPPASKVQPRDCNTLGHWPCERKDGYRCYWCSARCTVDGRSVGEMSK